MLAWLSVWSEVQTCIWPLIGCSFICWILWYIEPQVDRSVWLCLQAIVLYAVYCVADDRAVEQDLLPWLLDEFPYLHVSPATLHNMWHRGSMQRDYLSRVGASTRRRKTKAQEQVCCCNWNSLPHVIIIYVDVTANTFKKKLKTFYYTNC